MEKLSKALLVLADGREFHGYGIGHFFAQNAPAIGEVVFNTAMYGYQEVITDPSYAGQIICFTAPHIGNVGCNQDDIECTTVFSDGVIIRDYSLITSNYRAQESLSDFLKKNRKMGIYGIDTRALTQHLREHGSQMGAMAVGEDISSQRLREAAINAGSMEGRDYVKHVSCKEPYTWDKPSWGFKAQIIQSDRPHVVAIDCGAKQNILRCLVDVGFRVTVVPATYTTQQIKALSPDCLFYSNGPGDPAALPYVSQPMSELLGKLPIFGICLGHQMLGIATEAKTYKLKFGHRGANHPVREESSGRIEITVQNHGFAVDPATLKKDVRISHINLNDMTVEGLEIPDLKAFSVQYHPEASSGPHDSQYLFQRFYNLVCK